MTALDGREELDTANSHWPGLLQTAMSSESLMTALSSLGNDQQSMTAHEGPWTDDNSFSTCLSATASDYSLPSTEADVEVPGVVIGGAVVVDSLELLTNPKLHTAKSSESVMTARSSIGDDQLSTCLEATASVYSMPESETDVEWPYAVYIPADTVSTCLEASASMYSLPESETKVELPDGFRVNPDLQTAWSSESLLTAVSPVGDRLLMTARENVSTDRDTVSTCLDATASNYSLPASETDVELPGVVLGGVTIVDSLEMLANPELYRRAVDVEISEYEMPPSETDVSLAEGPQGVHI